MLLSLHIENIAVIRNVSIDFSQGFTALTGETGAGKSIIIDSINLILGARADKTLIRRGESRASVSAVFGELNDAALLALSAQEIALDEEGKIVISRTFSTDGHSSIKINGAPVSISTLREISASLITIHGQNDNIALVSKSSHIEMLDSYAKNSELLSEYSEIYKKMLSLRRALADHDKELEEKERVIDVLRYQTSEIEALKLKEGEVEILEDRLEKLKNIEKITRHAGFVCRALKNGEKANAIYILERSITSLRALAEAIPDADGLADELEECRIKIEDIADTVSGYTDGFDGDPVELIDKIQSRLNAIDRVKKKYGDSIEKILEFYNGAKEKLARFENSEEAREDICNDIRDAEHALSTCAKKLRERRIAAAQLLETAVCDSLSFLDMPKVGFVCSVKPLVVDGVQRFDKYGCDNVNFLISPNAGIEPMPLDRIASGGELARIMLSLKSVMADCDGIGTVIYDEIDSGVSGKTARKIGMKLKSASDGSQVLCVTHSAQIASLADTHLLISKSEGMFGTETSVRELDQSGRIDELSRILGGINVTDSQRLAAIDMLMGAE